MAIGDIIYVRSPVVIDAYAPASTLKTIFPGLVSINDYPAIKIQVVKIAESGGKARVVIVVVGQDGG